MELVGIELDGVFFPVMVYQLFLEIAENLVGTFYADRSIPVFLAEGIRDLQEKKTAQMADDTVLIQLHGFQLLGKE